MDAVSATITTTTTTITTSTTTTAATGGTGKQELTAEEHAAFKAKQKAHYKVGVCAGCSRTVK